MICSCTIELSRDVNVAPDQSRLSLYITTRARSVGASMNRDKKATDLSHIYSGTFHQFDVRNF